MKCGIDFETGSEIDLKVQGLSVYARHPSTKILCMAIKVEGEPTKLWVPGQPFPIRDASAISFSAQNAPFEFEIWNEVGVKRYGFPPLPIENLYCTLAMAYTHCLPGSLEKMAPALGIEKQKDMSGNRVMLQLSRPRSSKDGNVTWWTPKDAPEKFQALYDYCIQDVEVEDACKSRMLPLSQKERALWLLDHKINRRGIQIDIPKVKAAIEIIEAEKERLNSEIHKISKGEISSTSSVMQIKDYLEKRGVELSGVGKNEVSALLKYRLPDQLQRILEIRQEASKSSTAKLQSMLDRADDDGRVRYTLQYHGAGTGRWSGRGIQIQNFPRGSILKGNEVERAIEDLDKGAEYIDMFYGAPMTVISDCLRGMITAAPGKDLIVADFAAIEGRVLAWLAGQENALEIYRTHGKKYEAAAADIYGVHIDEVTKDQRQIGKVAELALGFQGGKGAFLSMASVYGLHVSEQRAEEIKVAWRRANPKIVKYWYDLEDAAVKAVMNPGTVFKAGHPDRSVAYKVQGSFLMCRLPSSRVLYYPYPQLEETKFGKVGVTYMSEDSKTRQWKRHSLYAGLAAENITQASSRDILAEALLRLEDNGYQTVSHVHDEIISENDKTFGSVENFIKIITTLPEWAKGLPLAAEGYRSKRYRK